MSDDLGFSWSQLSVEARQALLENPHGVVPAEHVPDIVRNGGSVHMAYWVASENAPEGFRLQGKQADVIAGWKTKLTQWWDGLTEDVREAVAEHRGRDLPMKYKDAVLEPNLVGGITTGTVGANEPARDQFDLAPITQDFIDWVVARKA